MADDKEVLREVWDGRIPVCFRLALDEITTMQPPDPFYLMVPRQSYFPLVTDNVQKHFMSISQEPGEMWLDFSGQPLKWHYPIGVLFDLYGSDAQLPWSLTVHFKSFPEEELLHCPNRLAVESHFMSTVKEADALKHRSQVINAMQKKDHSQLWLGLQNDKFDQFWAVNRKLMDKGSDESFKCIPFRIYKSDQMWVQRPIRPTKPSGEDNTLNDLLAATMPEAYQTDEAVPPRVVSHGIQLPLEVPLQWLSEHLSYPDNFLHLCMLPL